MTRQWFLAGLLPAFVVMLGTPASSQAQDGDWGRGWISPAYTNPRLWFPPRPRPYSYYYYPAPVFGYTGYTAPEGTAWYYYTPETNNDARVRLEVPADAEVWFDDYKTRQTGTDRIYETPPLDPDKSYAYEVRARWTENGKVMQQTRHVRVRAGRTVTVEFRR